MSSILLTVVLSQVIADAASDSLSLQLREKLADLAYQTTDKLDQGMFERYREVQLVAGRQSLGDPAVPLAVKQALIDRIQDTYHYYAWIGVTDNAGKILMSTKSILAGADASHRPWFINGLHGSHEGSDLHEGKMLASILPPSQSGEPLRFVDVAFPYASPDGRLAGVLGAHLSWEWARGIEQSVITPSMRRSHIEAMIVARDGTVLLGPKGLQGTIVRLSDTGAADEGGTMSDVETWPDHKQYLVGYSRSMGREPFPGFGWTVLVRQDAADAFAPVAAIKRKAMSVGFSIALVFSLFGVANARRISRPLVQFAGDVRNFRRHDAMVLSPPSATYAEITDLTDAFVRLVSDLQQNEAALRGLNATLEERVTTRTAELAASENRVRQILANSNDAFIAIGSSGEITDWNREAEQIFGYTSAEAIGRNLGQMIVPEDMRDAHDRGFQKFLESGEGPVINKRIEIAGMHASGRLIPIEMSVAAFHDGRGFVANAFLRDISARKAAEQIIRDSEKRLRAIADNLPVLISYIDKAHVFRFANATFEEWLGVTPEAALGKHTRDILGQALYEQRRPNMDRALRGEYVTFDMASIARGIDRHLHTTYVPDFDADGEVSGFYTLTTDVSEIKAAEQKMARLARHDSLTGLPNRYQLDEKLVEAVRRCRRSGRPMALMFLDIDHFKRINDQFGHAAGDEVLKQFSARLQQSVRVTDTVARLAGDEFVVLLEGLHAVEEAHVVAQKILDAIAAELHIGSRRLHITTSIGIAFSHAANLQPAQLLAQADQALYSVKEKGRNAFASTVA